MTDVPVSFSAFCVVCFPFTEAPYPPSITACIISSSFNLFSSYCTDMEFWSKFTFTSTTPSNFLTDFSTWTLQALHVNPVTSNFYFITHHDTPTQRTVHTNLK